MFSVVVLTLNEERNLPKCLRSALASDDILVLDSGSIDRTVEIARSFGARVAVNTFQNFGQQRNHAHEQIGFKHPWVFHLDADEELTPELVTELQTIAAANPPDVDGFLVAPKMYFRNRWIPHCTDFPAYQARFVHGSRFRFIQVGHGQREDPRMRMGKLTANYLHDLSAEGEMALEKKHRRYARQEAMNHLGAHGECPPIQSLFAVDPLLRRRALKAWSRHLPARGPLRFVYQYVLRGGFLDGRAGLAYCLLMARYEHWIGQEVRRLRRGGPGPGRAP
jgi:glycosyltransferase involved in cell wall biosynthesis